MEIKNKIYLNIGLRAFDIGRGLKVKKYLDYYEQTKTLEKKKIKEIQFEKLWKLLNHSYENSEFYNKRFKEVNFNPLKFKKLEDINKLPYLTRQEIRENFSSIISRDLIFNKKLHGVSSGSTGEPVKYIHNIESMSAGVAAGLFGWGISGWQFGAKGLHIWGNPNVVNREWKKLSSKIKRIAFNQQKFPAYQLTDLQEFWNLYQLIRKGNFEYIDGYTNAIYYLSQYIKENNYEWKYLDYIFTTGENLHHYQREEIEKNLGKVYDGYGCGEIKGIAYECGKCGSYHIIDPHVYLEYDLSEEIDGYFPIVVTDLDNFTFPLIRYKVNDYAKPTISNCNLPFSSLSSILGRESDIIKLKDGGILSVPSFFGSMLLNKTEGIVQYQVIREKEDTLTINFVINSLFNEKYMRIIQESLSIYLKNKINYEIQIVDNISVSKSGKVKLVIDKTLSE